MEMVKKIIYFELRAVRLLHCYQAPLDQQFLEVPKLTITQPSFVMKQRPGIPGGHKEGEGLL
eukprot:378424-Pyramimonas_sp.AAC.1